MDQRETAKVTTSPASQHKAASSGRYTLAHDLGGDSPRCISISSVSPTHARSRRLSPRNHRMRSVWNSLASPESSRPAADFSRARAARTRGTTGRGGNPDGASSLRASAPTIPSEWRAACRGTLSTRSSPSNASLPPRDNPSGVGSVRHSCHFQRSALLTTPPPPSEQSARTRAPESPTCRRKAPVIGSKTANTSPKRSKASKAPRVRNGQDRSEWDKMHGAQSRRHSIGILHLDRGDPRSAKPAAGRRQRSPASRSSSVVPPRRGKVHSAPVLHAESVKRGPRLGRSEAVSPSTDCNPTQRRKGGLSASQGDPPTATTKPRADESVRGHAGKRGKKVPRRVALQVVPPFNAELSRQSTCESHQRLQRTTGPMEDATVDDAEEAASEGAVVDYSSPVRVIVDRLSDGLTGVELPPMAPKFARSLTRGGSLSGGGRSYLDDEDPRSVLQDDSSVNSSLSDSPFVHEDCADQSTAISALRSLASPMYSPLQQRVPCRNGLEQPDGLPAKGLSQPLPGPQRSTNGETGESQGEAAVPQRLSRGTPALGLFNECVPREAAANRELAMPPSEPSSSYDEENEEEAVHRYMTTGRQRNSLPHDTAASSDAPATSDKADCGAVVRANNSKGFRKTSPIIPSGLGSRTVGGRAPPKTSAATASQRARRGRGGGGDGGGGTVSRHDVSRAKRLSQSKDCASAKVPLSRSAVAESVPAAPQPQVATVVTVRQRAPEASQSLSVVTPPQSRSPLASPKAPVIATASLGKSRGSLSMSIVRQSPRSSFRAEELPHGPTTAASEKSPSASATARGHQAVSSSSLVEQMCPSLSLFDAFFLDESKTKWLVDDAVLAKCLEYVRLMGYTHPVLREDTAAGRYSRWSNSSISPSPIVKTTSGGVATPRETTGAALRRPGENTSLPTATPVDAADGGVQAPTPGPRSPRSGAISGRRENPRRYSLLKPATCRSPHHSLFIDSSEVLFWLSEQEYVIGTILLCCSYIKPVATDSSDPSTGPQPSSTPGGRRPFVCATSHPIAFCATHIVGQHHSRDDLTKFRDVWETQVQLVLGNSAPSHQLAFYYSDDTGEVVSGPRAIEGIEQLMARTGAQTEGGDSTAEGSDGYRKLAFLSEMESGNLIRVERAPPLPSPLHSAAGASTCGAADGMFNLWLKPDFNCDKRLWFQFAVIGGLSGVPIHLRIMNTAPHLKLYRNGMKPVWRSGTSQLQWTPAESCVFRLKNTGSDGELSFVIVPKSSAETILVAFCVPYSYADLLCHITRWHSLATHSVCNICFEERVLCRTIDGRKLQLLIITSQTSRVSRRGSWSGGGSGGRKGVGGTACGSSSGGGGPTATGAYDLPSARAAATSTAVVGPYTNFAAGKKVVLISGRVHPGEVTASHGVHGLVSFLLSSDPRAVTLREYFVFFVVPMLNPDGVSRGHSRLDQRGVNLNRCYNEPDPAMQPTIAALSRVFTHLRQCYHDRFFLYIDFHSHASRSTGFVFGNYLPLTVQHWNMVFPRLLELHARDSFSFCQCQFSRGQMLCKDGASRVLFGDFLIHSYTLELTHFTNFRCYSDRYTALNNKSPVFTVQGMAAPPNALNVATNSKRKSAAAHAATPTRGAANSRGAMQGGRRGVSQCTTTDHRDLESQSNVSVSSAVERSGGLSQRRASDMVDQERRAVVSVGGPNRRKMNCGTIRQQRGAPSPEDPFPTALSTPFIDSILCTSAHVGRACILTLLDYCAVPYPGCVYGSVGLGGGTATSERVGPSGSSASCSLSAHHGATGHHSGAPSGPPMSPEFFAYGGMERALREVKRQMRVG